MVRHRLLQQIEGADEGSNQLGKRGSGLQIRIETAVGSGLERERTVNVVSTAHFFHGHGRFFIEAGENRAF